MTSISQARRGSACVPADGQRGMTLIEVLVTVVLISVGLLGVAALQIVSLKSNQEAYVRSQASVLAGDILDRIRANSAGFRTDQYNVDYNGTGTAGTTAGRDLAAWQASIDQLLPGAAGMVQRDPATNVVTITIQWTERITAAYQQEVAEDEEEEAEAETMPTFQTRSEI